MDKTIQSFEKKQKEILLERQKEYTEKLTKMGSGEIDPHLHRKTELTLPSIVIALRKIENGSYGKCIGCEEQIPQKRLELIPSALRCLECQKLEEKKNA